MSALIYIIILLVLQESKGMPEPDPHDPPPPAPQLPIDGNIWILLIAGILFGAYVIYRRNELINKAS